MKKYWIGLLLAMSVLGAASASAADLTEDVISATDEQLITVTEQEQMSEIEEGTTEAAAEETEYEESGIQVMADFSSVQPVLTSISGTSTDVTVTWNAVSGASRYHIYRQTAGEGGWSKIGSSESTSYTDSSAKGTESYYYAIRAIKGGNTNYTRSERSEAYLRVGRPSLELAEESTDGIKIWWKKSVGSEKYYVYRRKKGATNWKELASTTDTSYEDKTAKLGHSYEYTVRASCKNGSTEFLSGRSPSGVGASRVMTVPEVNSISGVSTSVTLKWSAAKGAERYYIYRMSSGGEWEEVGSTKKLTYTDKTAKADTTYRYRVRAGRTMKDGSIALGGYQSPGIQRPGTTKLTSATSEERGICVRWEKVTGVKEYRVYRKNSADSKWKLLGTTTHKYYLDQNVKNKSYYYTVRAVGKNPATFYGGFDKNGIEGKYTYGIVALESVTNTTNGVKVQWTKLKKATGYQVYRKSGKESKWTRIKVINKGTTLKYTDKDVKSGTTYTYTVRAVKNGQLNDGYDTTGLSIVRLSSPVLTEVTRGDDLLNVGWKKVTGASGYEIYRKTDGSEWEKIDDVKGGSTLTYQDKNVSNGKLYMYSVRAKKSSYLSGFDQTGIGRVFLKAVEITAVSHTKSKTVTIKWSKNSQADRYVVSYSTSSGFKNDKRVSVKDNTATVGGLSQGEIYYFRVNALKEVNGVKHFSKWSGKIMVAIEE